MSTFWNDLKNSLVSAISIVSAVITSTTTGSAADLGLGDGGSCAVFHCGVITDGTHTITMTESDTSGGAYTAVPSADTKVIAAADSSTVVVVNFKRSKRWVKVVSTVAGATTGGIYGAAVYALKKAG